MQSSLSPPQRSPCRRRPRRPAGRRRKASAYRVGTYGAGHDGQGVQLFGPGAQVAHRANARDPEGRLPGTGAAVNAGGPGIDAPSVSVNANGELVSAWTLDTQQPGPIGLAATLGRRTSLPKTATVLKTDGQSVQDVSTAIDGLGTGVVARNPRAPPPSRPQRCARARLRAWSPSASGPEPRSPTSRSVSTTAASRS